MGEKHQEFDDPEPINHLNIETDDIENKNGQFSAQDREPDYPSEINASGDQYIYVQEDINKRPPVKK